MIRITDEDFKFVAKSLAGFPKIVKDDEKIIAYMYRYGEREYRACFVRAKYNKAKDKIVDYVRIPNVETLVAFNIDKLESLINFYYYERGLKEKIFKENKK